MTLLTPRQIARRMAALRAKLLREVAQREAEAAAKGERT